MYKIKRAQLRLLNDGFQPKSSCNIFEGWGAAMVGAAVVGGAVQASSAKSAAGTQAGAAKNAAQASLMATQQTNALQYLMYQQQMANASPFMQIQGMAASALANGLGLGTPNTGTGQMYPQQQYGTQNPTPQYGAPQQPRPVMQQPGTQPVQGAPVDPQYQQSSPKMGTADYRPTQGGGIKQILAAGPNPMIPPTPNDTAGQQPTPGQPAGPGVVGSSGSPTTNVEGIGNIGIVNAGANQQQLNAGGASQAPGSLLAHFSNADLNSQMAPNYGFIMNQGQQANANWNAAHGITGGQAMRDQQNFTQNTASGFYQQAFSNYLTQQQQNIQSLSALAGNGAVGAANGAAQSTGAGIASNTQTGIGAYNNYMTGGAAATAAGQVGAGNAFAGAIGNATSAVFMNRLVPPTPSGG